MHRILVADQLGTAGLDLLEKAESVDHDVVTGLSESDLASRIGDYHGLIVRSGTSVTAGVLEAGGKLRVVGRAGIGVDNIDVPAATERGVIVMNTPQANSVATAEHTFSLMLAAARHTPDAHAALAAGSWERSRFVGVELNRKTLGVIGFGRIGRLVATRAQAFGMDVIAYDPFVSEEVGRNLGVTLVNMGQLFGEADYVTLHVPLSPETTNIIDDAAIAAMKDGVVVINAARGELVDEDALAAGVRSGKVRAAGLDVYRREPPMDSPLIGMPNVVHTPHLGASTVEAQRDVAADIVEQVIDALNGVDIRNAVNLPFQAGPDFQAAMPYVALAEKLGTLQAALARGPVRRVELEVNGDVVKSLTRPIAAGLLAGLLRSHVDTVNYVNAPVLAEQQGLAISQARGVAARDYVNLVTCRVHWDGGQRDMAGVLFGGKEPRIVQVGDYHIDADPSGLLLVMINEDVPGVIGMVGTTLGEYGVNIGEWRLGRGVPGGEALSFINLDSEPPPEALEALRSQESITRLLLLRL